MQETPGYDKHVDMMNRDEFIQLFSTDENPEKWFSKKELEMFSFPKNARSLAGRYLIKKRICDRIGEHRYITEIEILNDAFGKPEISYGKAVEEAIERAGVREIFCSISHSRNYITGMTIFCC